MLPSTSDDRQGKCYVPIDFLMRGDRQKGERGGLDRRTMYTCQNRYRVWPHGVQGVGLGTIYSGLLFNVCFVFIQSLLFILWQLGFSSKGTINVITGQRRSNGFEVVLSVNSESMQC
jgi:hypothetical protein